MRHDKEFSLFRGVLAIAFLFFLTGCAAPRVLPKSAPLRKSQIALQPKAPLVNRATGASESGGVTLVWNANPETDIAGYRLYYGSASRAYTQSVDAGNSTAQTVSNLPDGTVYFALKAFNTAGFESQFSDEVTYLVSQPPTPTPPATPTPTATATASATASVTATATATSTATATATVGPSASVSPTATATISPPSPSPTSSPGLLVNISTRAFVQTGDNTLIAGFVIAERPRKIIARAIGPSLASFFPVTLSNPTLELHRSSDGALIAINDNWRSDQESEIIATGIPPGNDLESAIVRTLAPGSYTAIVRGVNGVTGVALVEVYAIE